jgi:teichuronopeptide biosynthesis TupA-like protein
MQQRDNDAAVVIRNYETIFGRPPNLRNPTTFNEKIIYKMIHDRRPILTRLADKLQARDYVAERIGAHYLTELYQVCRSSAEIDWQKLPRRFAIKTNHGSGMYILVLDESWIDVSRLSSQLDQWLGMNFYWQFREWCYLDIEPAIFIEELLADADGASVNNWKFFTFDGRAEFVRIDLKWAGQPAICSYDRRLSRLKFRRGPPEAPTDPVFPHNVELMFSLAERLGSGLDFLRVDMYNVNGRIVFGEFTNYPGAGLDRFHPPEFDELFGSKWRWPPNYA